MFSMKPETSVAVIRGTLLAPAVVGALLSAPLLEKSIDHALSVETPTKSRVPDGEEDPSFKAEVTLELTAPSTVQPLFEDYVWPPAWWPRPRRS